MKRQHQTSRSRKLINAKTPRNLLQNKRNMEKPFTKRLTLSSKHTEIDVMDSKHQAALNKQEDAINNTIIEMKQVIQDVKSLLDTPCFKIPVQD